MIITLQHLITISDNDSKQVLPTGSKAVKYPVFPQDGVAVGANEDSGLGISEDVVFLQQTLKDSKETLNYTLTQKKKSLTKIELNKKCLIENNKLISYLFLR